MRMAQFLGTSASEVTRGLGELKRVGLLLRRGRMLRIAPDVLADHILSEACLTDAGAPTGFGDEVYRAFGSDCLSSLLRNLGELDWRVRAGSAVETSVLDSVWSDLRRAFRDAGHRGRALFLKELEECAYFVPKRVFELVREAVNSPSPEEDEVIFPGILTYSHSSVLEEVPELLRRCAYSESCIAGCLDVLWKLACGAGSPEKEGIGDKAFGVLREIAKYERAKPISINRTVLNAARRWLKRADAFNGRRSPIDVLEPLLAKSGEESWSDSKRFFSRPFLVRPAAVADLRRELLSVLEQCLQSTDGRVVCRAVQALGKGLSGPQPILNMEIKEESLQKWEPEQLQILSLVEKLATSSPPPHVLVTVMHELRPIARFVRLPAVKKRAAEIVRSIPQSFEFLVTRSLHPEARRWEDFENEDGNTNLSAIEDRERARMEPLAEEFWRRFPGAATVVAELDRITSELRSVVIECSPSTLAWWLLKLRPEASREFAEELIRRPESSVIDCLRIPLLHLRISSPEICATIAHLALDTGVLAVRKAIGMYFRWDLSSDAMPSENEPELINRLLADGNSAVRQCGIGGLRWLARYRPREALDHALELSVEDAETAGELCQFVDEKWGIPNSFTTNDWAVFVRKFDGMRRIDYHIADFLKVARRHVPGEVLEFLLRRIGAERATDGTRIEAAYSTELAIVFGDRPAGVDELNSICDWAFSSDRSRLSEFADLFDAVTHGYGEPGLSVLETRLSSANAEELRAGVELLAAAPNSFPFDHRELVELLLDRADSFGEECFSEVEDAFVRIATMGERCGIPGEPFPQDVDVRDRCIDSIQGVASGSCIARLYDRILQGAEINIRRVGFGGVTGQE